MRRPTTATWLDYSVMLINLPTDLVRIRVLPVLSSQNWRSHAKVSASGSRYCGRVVFAHGKLEVLSGEGQRYWL